MTPESDPSAAAVPGSAGRVPRWGLVAGATGLLALTLTLNFLLAVAVLDKPYARVLMAPVLTLAAGLRAELEAASPVAGEAELDALLQRWQRLIGEQVSAARLVLRGSGPGEPGEVEVSLTSWAGRILASSASQSLGRMARRELFAERAAVGAAARLVSLDGDAYVVSPYRAGDDKVRRLLVKVPRAAVRLSAAALLVAHAGFALTIFAVGAGALALGLGWPGRRDHRGGAARRTGVLVMGVILACQLAATGVLLGGLARDSLASARAGTALLLDHLAGRPPERATAAAPLAGAGAASEVLRELSREIPELEGATLTMRRPGGPEVEVARSERAGGSEWVASAGRALVGLLGLDGQLSVQGPAPGEARDRLAATLSPAGPLKRVLASAVDSLTVLLIAILVSAELLVILRHYAGAAGSPAADRAGTQYVLVRPVAFLYVLGIDLSMSFLPLHMERLYTPLFGLSKAVVTGLPISAEFFCVGVAILAAGVWYDRRGWHEPLFVGLGLATAGGVCSWLATSALAFIVSRALVGTGYGLALMASQGFVIGNTDTRTKAHGLAYLFSGLYAGSICGGAAGGILAERYGYRMTFFLGAVTLALVLPCALAVLRHATRRLEGRAAPGPAPAGAARRLGRFLGDRRILALMLFSSLPASVAVVGFLNYFSPLYLQRLGVPESTIAQLLVIYGICLIYCGPIVGKYADSAESRRAVIFAGCLLGAAAFLAFTALGGVAAVAVAILLMGVSHSLVLSPQSAYLLDLPVTRELGQGMALGIFRSSSRLGQMAGPMVFSFVAMSPAMRADVGWLGAAYLVFAFVFLLLTRQARKSWLPALRLAQRDLLGGETELEKRRDG